MKTRDIPFLIYERDPTPNYRGAGWGLTIHWALQIFKSLITDSIFQCLPEAYVDPEAERTGEKGHFLFYNARTGEAIWKISPSERVRLRGEGLREVLMDGIEVKWSKQLNTFAPNKAGINAMFMDGTEAEGSMIVGCDGSRSRIRELLVTRAFENFQLPSRLLGVCRIPHKSCKATP